MAKGARQAGWEFFGAEAKRRRENAGFTRAAPGRTADRQCADAVFGNVRR